MPEEQRPESLNPLLTRQIICAVKGVSDTLPQIGALVGELKELREFRLAIEKEFGESIACPEPRPACQVAVSGLG
jgi:hypothetical protein